MSPFTLNTRQGVSLLNCAPLFTISPVIQAFSTRLGGVSDVPYASLNLGFGGDDERARVQINRQRFAQATGVNAEALVLLRQVHGSHVVPVTRMDDPLSVKGTPGDALITNQPEVPLAVITADCFPVVLVAPEAPAVGIVHAGRRGTAVRITQAAVDCMCDRFGVRPQGLYAAIGPGIGGCCYEVDAASAEPFCAQLTDRSEIVRPSRPGHVYLDLQQANLLQLHAAGVPPAQVWVADLCTACHPEWFYSWRRDGPRSGRMLNVIMLKPR